MYIYIGIYAANDDDAQMMMMMMMMMHFSIFCYPCSDATSVLLYIDRCRSAMRGSCIKESQK